MTRNKTDQQVNDGSKKTCFVIMPISDVDGYKAGHFREVYNELILPAAEEAGYECQLATTTSSAHMIQLDVVTKVATADLCICDLSTNNPNVLFEYGIRQAFDRPTVLIKDDRSKRIFDLSGFRDIEYDCTLRISNILSTRQELVTAIRDTIEGVSDKSQIFSLVSLMKITKASFPSGDLSPQDARLVLLERKIDTLTSVLLNLGIPGNKLYGSGEITTRDETFELYTRGRGTKIMVDRASGIVRTHTRLPTGIVRQLDFDTVEKFLSSALVAGFSEGDRARIKYELVREQAARPDIFS